MGSFDKQRSMYGAVLRDVCEDQTIWGIDNNKWKNLEFRNKQEQSELNIDQVLGNGRLTADLIS